MWWHVKRLSGLVVAAVVSSLLATGCIGGSGGQNTYHAVFSLAVAISPSRCWRSVTNRSDGRHVGSISSARW